MQCRGVVLQSSWYLEGTMRREKTDDLLLSRQEVGAPSRLPIQLRDNTAGTLPGFARTRALTLHNHTACFRSRKNHHHFVSTQTIVIITSPLKLPSSLRFRSTSRYKTRSKTAIKQPPAHHQPPSHRHIIKQCRFHLPRS